MTSQENRIREGLGLSRVKETKERENIIEAKIREPKDRPRKESRHNLKQKPLKETVLYQGTKKLIQIATKNHIPKKHDDVIKMLNRLEKEEKEMLETEEAKKRIKEIQRINKERNKQKRLARRAKLKKFLRIGKKI